MNFRSGRRIPAGGDPFHDLEQPGDYSGPVNDPGHEDRPTVHFLVPVDHTWGDGRYHLAAVCSPPHVFRECDDGSLEIRESIAVDGAVTWHGYLDEGHVWRTL